jgi:hypothetical protein
MTRRFVLRRCPLAFIHHFERFVRLKNELCVLFQISGYGWFRTNTHPHVEAVDSFLM